MADFPTSLAFTLNQEGGYNPDDLGSPSNYGIRQEDNPDLDVQNLGLDDAARVYKSRYWDKAGISNLPDNMKLPAFDTVVNHGVEGGLKLIQQANNDPQKLIQLRQAAYDRLAQNPKYADKLPAWNNRLTALKQQISTGPQAPAPNSDPWDEISTTQAPASNASSDPWDSVSTTTPPKSDADLPAGQYLNKYGNNLEKFGRFIIPGPATNEFDERNTQYLGQTAVGTGVGLIGSFLKGISNLGQVARGQQIQESSDETDPGALNIPGGQTISSVGMNTLMTAFPGAIKEGVAERAATAPMNMEPLGLAKVPPEMAELANKAVNKFNIPLARSQIEQGNFAKTLASTAKEIPFSGAEGFARKQQLAFNKAVASTIGQDTNKITPEVVDAAHLAIGEQFDNVLAGRRVNVSDSIYNRLSQIKEDAFDNLTSEHAKIIEKNVNKFVNDIDHDGTISGEKLNSLRSNIASVIKGTKNDATMYMRRILTTVIDASVDGLPEGFEGKTKLNAARLQYKNLKTIEPLAAKNPTGDIPPSLLLQRVLTKFPNFSRGGGGDLGDLARIGKTYLQDPIANSGTPRRLAAYGAIFGGPSVVAQLAHAPEAALASAAGGLGGLGVGRGFNWWNTMQSSIKGGIAKTMKNAKTKEPKISPSSGYSESPTPTGTDLTVPSEAASQGQQPEQLSLPTIQQFLTHNPEE